MSSAVSNNSSSASRQPTSGNWFFPRFILFPFLAMTAYPFFIMGTGGDHWAMQTVWIFFLSYCWFCIGGSFHESVHETLFNHKWINVWYGRFLGIMIGIPYTTYKESHRRHHAYLNTPADYELWPYSDPNISLGTRRIFVWIDLIFGVVTAPYIYARIYFLKDFPHSFNVRRAIFWEYIALILFWSFVLIAIYFLCHHPDETVTPFNPLWVLPLFIAAATNTARKFVEHLGMKSSDPFLGTRTILPGNFISKMLLYFNFDIAIHGPHHRYPHAQHDELPIKLKAYQALHPELEIPVYRSYTSAFFSMLPLLWTFPATGGSQKNVPQDSNKEEENINGKNYSPLPE